MNTVLAAKLLIIFGLIMLVWLTIKCVAWIKRSNINTELWGTVFEGMTQKLVDQDLLKKPAIYSEKKAKRNGQGLDDDEVNLESLELMRVDKVKDSSKV